MPFCAILNLHHFYQTPSIMSLVSSDSAAFSVLVRRTDFTAGAFVMAIQDYVKSIAATEKVSKDQVFRFLEMQFSRADKNHDGELDLDELAVFAHAVSCPESDQR
jgi:hypothetical protein